MNSNQKISIAPETIARTKCDKGFTCLSSTPIYCAVLATLGHALVKLECQKKLDCRHNRAYGALQACNCPVRHEIFTKYGR